MLTMKIFLTAMSIFTLQKVVSLGNQRLGILTQSPTRSSDVSLNTHLVARVGRSKVDVGTKVFERNTDGSE